MPQLMVKFGELGFKVWKVLIFFWKCPRDIMFHGTRAGNVLLTVSSTTTGLYHVGYLFTQPSFSTSF